MSIFKFPSGASVFIRRNRLFFMVSFLMRLCPLFTFDGWGMGLGESLTRERWFYVGRTDFYIRLYTIAR